MSPELCSKGFRAANVDLVHAVQVVVNLVETAEVLQQSLRRLLPDTRHAFYVVHRIARQGQEVRNLLGSDTERTLDLVVAEFALAREIPEDVVAAQQLCQVLVTADNRR